MHLARKLSRTVAQAALGLAVVLCGAVAALATELVMVEQRGCEWCARWDAEIAPAYPNTREGHFAPLRRVDLRAMPEDLKVARRVTFTPTFLIVQDGTEIARLEGYPGEDFFWPVLNRLLRETTEFNDDKGENG